jgi:N-methylhydantoinase B/oxoprolinase/acetone carboxylase alpha subunit
MTAVILSNSRQVAPFGLSGGGDAKPGRSWVQRNDGSTEELKSTDQADLETGDVFAIETPGGGGYGKPS